MLFSEVYVLMIVPASPSESIRTFLPTTSSKVVRVVVNGGGKAGSARPICVCASSCNAVLHADILIGAIRERDPSLTYSDDGVPVLPPWNDRWTCPEGAAVLEAFFKAMWCK